MKTRLALALIVAASLAISGCATAGGPSPTPSGPASSGPAATPTPPAPTPTPIAADVAGPTDAAALVIATDPRFAGAIELTPDIIGASRWWEAEALDDGAYRITLTVGWGDCPAGCINRHTWIFEVTADGQVTLIEESGDAVPEGSLPE
ncbi:MAG: hypothetical protein L0227_13160 [Chloroflexi bacterium]|nr:hypothetical protein [Chloroflexota bacterium]